LDRNPSSDTIASNDKLRNIWKQTLSMSHAEYLKKVSQEAERKDPNSSASKALRSVASQQETDADSDDENKKKMKKGLKDGSLSPKQNVYQ
jgi:hypothetical protein